MRVEDRLINVGKTWQEEKKKKEQEKIKEIKKKANPVTARTFDRENLSEDVEDAFERLSKVKK